ncbi:MAG: RsmG family class I SAM-dependent methyltransferase [Candidatus Shikimatogenerans sp. Ttur]|uniref:Ribosomal RNA small subunit methyltransferase G n=1 Tax=Candidatus Shikimatogenerans sp. Ttur TaxID=3158569 RepID=A0AAU7ZXZ5_9FLAO
MNNNINIINKYFNLNKKKIKKIKKFYKFHKKNINKINLISKNSFKNFYINHIIYSLSIIKIIIFKNKTKILDYGTGGGFPGIPLSIIFPKVKFILIDSIKKKINKLKIFIKKNKIKNVKLINFRAEKIKIKVDFILIRFIKNINYILKNMKKNINKISKNKMKNGFFFYKGNKIKNKKYILYHLYKYIKLNFFKNKYIIYIKNNIL